MNARQRVHKFLKAMAAWERWYDREQQQYLDCDEDEDEDDGEEALDRLARARLQEIFDERLTRKGKSEARFGGRLLSLTVADPPDFDQKIDRVEPGKVAGTTYVYTGREDFDTWYRYVVIETPGKEPLVDDSRAQVGRDRNEWNLKLY